MFNLPEFDLVILDISFYTALGPFFQCRTCKNNVTTTIFVFIVTIRERVRL